MKQCAERAERLPLVNYVDWANKSDKRQGLSMYYYARTAGRSCQQRDALYHL